MMLGVGVKVRLVGGVGSIPAPPLQLCFYSKAYVKNYSNVLVFHLLDDWSMTNLDECAFK